MSNSLILMQLELFRYFQEYYIKNYSKKLKVEVY